MGKFVTVTWLADHQQVDRGTIRQHIYWSKLDAFKIGNDWRIWIEEESENVLRLTPVINRRGIAKREYYFNRSRRSGITKRFNQHHSKGDSCR